MQEENETPAEQAAHGERGLRWLARALFYVALPLALIATNVRFAFNEEHVYKYSIDHYDVSAVTHIPRADLIAATEDIRAYFNNSDNYLRTRVHDPSGSVVPLFNTKEVLHMRDVKQLVRWVYDLQLFALCVIAAYIAATVLWARELTVADLARQAMRGSIATCLLLVAFGIAGSTGFDSLFVRFHEVAFGNNFWQLDPLHDHLVQMFPEGFWLDATLLIGGLTLLEALLIGGTSWLYLRRHQDRVPGDVTVPTEAGDRPGDIPQAVG